MVEEFVRLGKSIAPVVQSVLPRNLAQARGVRHATRAYRILKSEPERLPIALIRIAKDWDWRDLLRRTPGVNGIWEGVRFTTIDAEECDEAIRLLPGKGRNLGLPTIPRDDARDS